VFLPVLTEGANAGDVTRELSARKLEHSSIFPVVSLRPRRVVTMMDVAKTKANERLS
jgi:hypothetical protein